MSSVALLLAVLALIAAACSGDDSSSEANASDETGPTGFDADVEPEESLVSGDCISAMKAVEAVPATLAAVEIIATASACQTVPEWLAALRAHPGALGLTDRADVGELEVETVCAVAPADAPMCVNAAALGIIPG